MLIAATSAQAHEDPPGCFQTGPAIIVSVFRANGTTGVVGTVSNCETINYQATLQKAQDSDDICAFSMGVFGRGRGFHRVVRSRWISAYRGCPC